MTAELLLKFFIIRHTPETHQAWNQRCNQDEQLTLTWTSRLSGWRQGEVGRKSSMLLQCLLWWSINIERTHANTLTGWDAATTYCHFHASQYIFITTNIHWHIKLTWGNRSSWGARLFLMMSDDSAAGGPKYFNSESKMIWQTSLLSTWSKSFPVFKWYYY